MLRRPRRRARGARRADAHREGAAGLWRNAFIRMPYARERMVPRAIIADTFETAITWDRFEAFHDAVKRRPRTRSATRPAATVRSRAASPMSIPTGRRPISPFHALGRHGALIEQWRAIKTRGERRADRGGGTITHHHAVGRDHRPWYDRQRPAALRRALRAAKRTLDPRGVMNPGVLIDP